MSETAANKLDDALTDSARSMRAASDKLDNLVGRAADKLDSTAAYVRSHDPARGFVQIQQMIRRHPTAIVAGAAAAGIILGMALGVTMTPSSGRKTRDSADTAVNGQ
jgi:ElaB/YqjD/DUF883 family membrane-anchored ribosome-binding protein